MTSPLFLFSSFFFFDSLSFSLPQMILPLEEALSFTLTSLQFQYYVRNDYFLNVIVRTQKNIGILFEQFLSHFPINFPSASFTHSSLPFTLSLFTFPTLRFDVNFKAIFAHSFPSFAPVSKKKKKYPFSSVVRSLSSSFLFRSSQFPLAPSPSPTLPHCFHGTTWLEQATGSDATHRGISR